MNVTQYRTLCVIFPIAFGGNHFTNLISTSALLENRTQTDDYYKFLLEQYQQNRKKIHVGDIEFWPVDEQSTVYIKQSTKTYPLCGHLPGYIATKNYLEPLGKVGFILFHSDYICEQLYQRASHIRTSSISDHQKKVDCIDEFLKNYNKDILSNHYNLHKQDIHTIDPNLLFQANIIPLIHYLNSTTNLNLDANYCQQLHNLWVDNILPRFKEPI